MRKIIFVALCGLTGSVLGACGSDDTVTGDPQITAATVDQSPVEPDPTTGDYVVNLSVTFDDVVDVDSYNFDSSAAGIHVSNTFSATPSGILPLVIDLPNGTASGTVDFDVSVTDVDNVTSNDFQGVVILDQ